MSAVNKVIQGVEKRFEKLVHSERDQNSTPPINVGLQERELSIVAGAAIAVFGLSRPVGLAGFALIGLGAAVVYRGWTGQCNLYKALGIDSHTGDQNQPSADPEEYNESGIHIEYATTINRPAAELYEFWRNFENLPQFMTHLQSVKVIDEQSSQWTANGPLGMSVQWNAKIINDKPSKLIAWQSVGSPDVDNSGSVTFLPATNGVGTVVRVKISYIPPAGRVGNWVAKLFNEDPKHQATTSLRQFKQLMETGEVTSNGDGKPRGSHSRIQFDK